MDARVHRPLNIIEFNANVIARQCHELSKQLRHLHIDAALLSETNFKPLRKVFHSKLSEKAELLL
jgi:hypothetical protein